MELNEQTLENILTRQRKEFESTLDASLMRQDEKLEAALARQDEKLEAALARQDEKLDVALVRQDGKLEAALQTQDKRFEQLDAKIDFVAARLEAAIVRQGDQFERFMGIQVEDLKSQIQLVAEGVSSALEQITQMRNENEERSSAILHLEVKQLAMESQLESKVDRAEFADLDARVVKLESGG